MEEHNFRLLFEDIFDGLEEQLKDIKNNRTNFFEELLTLLNSLEEEFDSTNEFNSFRKDILIEFYEKLSEKIFIELETIDDFEISELIESVNAIYEFFVIRFKYNFIELFKNYIFDNFTDLSKELKNSRKFNNDLEYKGFIKISEDEEFNLVFIKMSEVIDLVKSEVINNTSDFIKYIIISDKEEIINEMINNYFITNKLLLTKDYLEIFFEPLKIENFKLTIETSIKFKMKERIK